MQNMLHVLTVLMCDFQGVAPNRDAKPSTRNIAGPCGDSAVFFREGTHIVETLFPGIYFWTFAAFHTAICCAWVAFLACVRHMCVQLMWSPVSQRQKNMYT